MIVYTSMIIEVEFCLYKDFIKNKGIKKKKIVLIGSFIEYFMPLDVSSDRLVLATTFIFRILGIRRRTPISPDPTGQGKQDQGIMLLSSEGMNWEGSLINLHIMAIQGARGIRSKF